MTEVLQVAEMQILEDKLRLECDSDHFKNSTWTHLGTSYFLVIQINGFTIKQ